MHTADLDRRLSFPITHRACRRAHITKLLSKRRYARAVLDSCHQFFLLRLESEVDIPITDIKDQYSGYFDVCDRAIAGNNRQDSLGF